MEMNFTQRKLNDFYSTRFGLEECDLKIIGITGTTGSGKTTYAKMLSEVLQNSKLIHGDDFMYESIMYYKSDFERIFGKTVTEKFDIKTFRQAGIEENVYKWQEYLSAILPYMDFRIKDVLMDVDASINYIVIEWFHLPFTQVWKNSDCRILIIATDNGIRHDKLITRMQNRQQYRQYSREDLRKSIEMKDNLSNSLFNILMNCIVVKNSYDDTLQHEAIRVARIMNNQTCTYNIKKEGSI